MGELKKTHENQLKELTDQNLTLQESQKKLNQIVKNEVIQDLDNIKEHPRFERIKDQLKMPEIKEGKFDLEAFKDEDAWYTKNKLAEYRKLGIFEEDGKTQTNVTTPKVPNIAEVDIVDLAINSPAEARKVLDKKRRRTLF